MSTTEILVCVTCRPPGADPEAPRAGEALYQEVLEASLRADAPYRVRPIRCMSGCRRACAVAVQAPHKTAYMFGDLPPTAEAADAVIACAHLHQASADGTMARETRPAPLREGILARLPPVASTAMAALIGAHESAAAPSELYAATAEIRAALAHCESHGLTDEVVAAALLAELMPRLAHRFGPQAAASVFGNMASAMAEMSYGPSSGRIEQ